MLNSDGEIEEGEEEGETHAERHARIVAAAQVGSYDIEIPTEMYELIESYVIFKSKLIFCLNCNRT